MDELKKLMQRRMDDAHQQASRFAEGNVLQLAAFYQGVVETSQMVLAWIRTQESKESGE